MIPNLLVVDDEASVRKSLARLLAAAGYSVRVADCARAALGEARKGTPDLVLLDICLPDMSGLEVLARLKEMSRRVVVIVMTAYESTRDAVLAMKRGAYDYLSKPFNIDAVRLLVKRALMEGRDGKQEGETSARRPADTTWQGSACDRMIGASPAMNRVLDIVHRLPAGSRSNVLIEGETGTGKELLAHAIHETNGRATDPFVAISCGAIPRELIESELFGYDQGAFTGARREGRQGAFERAGAGTIFLDEIGELDLDLQVKLLRVLEAREFVRVGGQEEIRLKARVIAATNRDLKREVDRGRFRADLYFRLDVVPVTLPPLRDRDGDVILLAEAFLQEFNSSFGKSFRTISPAAQHIFESYSWPGNVRELRNTIERIVVLETGEAITAEQLATFLPASRRASEDTGSLSSPKLAQQASEDGRGDGSAVPCRLPCRLAARSCATFAPEGVQPNVGGKEQIVLALERTGGNVVRAARLLGLKRGALRYRMEKLGIARDTACSFTVLAACGTMGSHGRGDTVGQDARGTLPGRADSVVVPTAHGLGAVSARPT
jgi:DNA-binding NtrC family response regulator